MSTWTSWAAEKLLAGRDAARAIAANQGSVNPVQEVRRLASVVDTVAHGGQRTVDAVNVLEERVAALERHAARVQAAHAGIDPEEER